jgi:predicted nucleic acid-binding Zn ribbon protein
MNSRRRETCIFWLLAFAVFVGWVVLPLWNAARQLTGW